MAQNDVQTKYQNTKDDIANLLGFFECEMAKQPSRVNWDTLGSLRKVRQDLIETLSFLSGVEPHAIEETLEEERMLDK